MSDESLSGARAAALRAALAPPRAHGEPVIRAESRAEPEDFVVEEDLGFAPAGSGQHVLLKVRKRDANTQWVGRELARLVHCRVGEVGYAGLKDRRAVAVQWFSVPRPRTALDWTRLRGDGFEVLEAHAHTRKLPRGALAGNRFAVRLHPADGDGTRLCDRLAGRLEDITRRGVPNYFGPQRFGRAGGNLHLARADLGSLGHAQRGFALSAARSVVFNAVLAARVRDGSWERLLAGDLAMLDGRGSFFLADPADETLGRRCRALEIHPTGPLWGSGSPATGFGVLELESRIAAEFPQENALCVAARMVQERRGLRLAVRDLECVCEPGAALLRFRLTRGGFATAVLRELVASPAADGFDQEDSSST